MATTRIATQPRVFRSKKSAKSTDEALLAQARAVRDTLEQLESGHIPKGGVKLPLFNKDGTDFANAPAPVRPAPKPAPRRRSADSSLPDLERHRRKCLVCKHPDREEIEEQFIHWRQPSYIAHDFDLEDDRYIARHAHALGLYARRRENYLFTLENLLERGDEIELTASAYMKAVRAYACMCDTVRWTEPAIRVIGLRDHSAAAVHQPDVVEHSSSLPQAASTIPATAAQSPTPLEEMNDGHCSSSSLPKAAFDQPAPASSAPSLCRADPLAAAEQIVASPSSSLPQAAIPDSAQFASRSLHRDAPSAPLHHSQKAKDAEASPLSSLATSHSPLPSNRPSPRLETGVSDRKQRKEANPNRP